MLNLSVDSLILALNGMPPELLLIVELVLCFGAILVFLRLFGETGLQAYVLLAILGANIQVLKPVQFGIFMDPVALGTVLFASTYLCTDILAEHYGPKAARKAVFMGFAGYLVWTIMMIVTLGFRPLTPAEAGEGLAWALDVQPAMQMLFQPAPAFFLAGMAAYMISQLNDVWLFDRIRRATGGRALWLRNNASTAVSSLIDNTIFSVLAWVVLAAEPMETRTLIVTYILGTYWLRLAVAVLDTPFMYLARYCIGGQVPPRSDSRTEPRADGRAGSEAAANA